MANFGAVNPQRWGLSDRQDWVDGEKAESGHSKAGSAGPLPDEAPLSAEVTEAINLLASESESDQIAGKKKFEWMLEDDRVSVITELLWTRNDLQAANRAMETYKRADGRSNETLSLMYFFEALTEKMTKTGHTLDENDRALLSNWEGELAPYMTATLNRASAGTTGDDLRKIFYEEFRVPQIVCWAESKAVDAQGLFNEATPEVQASAIAVLLWHHKDLATANRLMEEYKKAGGSKNNAIDADKFLVAFTNQMTAEGHLVDQNDIEFLRDGWEGELGRVFRANGGINFIPGWTGYSVNLEFHGPVRGLSELWVIEAAESSDANLQAQASEKFESMALGKKASVIVQLLWDRHDPATAKRLMQNYTKEAGGSETRGFLDYFIQKMNSSDRVLDANAIQFLNEWGGPWAPVMQKIAQHASVGMTGSSLRDAIEMGVADDIVENAKKGIYKIEDFMKLPMVNRIYVVQCLEEAGCADAANEFRSRSSGSGQHMPSPIELQTPDPNAAGPQRREDTTLEEASTVLSSLNSDNPDQRETGKLLFADMSYDMQAFVIAGLLQNNPPKPDIAVAALMGNGVVSQDMVLGFLDAFSRRMTTDSRTADADTVKFLQTWATSLADSVGNTSFIYYAVNKIAQGTTSGMNGNAFQQLVNDQFRGGSNPGFSRLYYDPMHGAAYYENHAPLYFNGGPRPGDVQQASVGDCYFLAALAGLASVNPAFIQSMIADTGNGTYAVRFFDKNGQVQWVSVDNKTTTAGAYNDNCSWVALVEKAFAKFRAEHHLDVGYAYIDHGTDQAFRALFGMKGRNIPSPGPDASKETNYQVGDSWMKNIEASLRAGLPVMIFTTKDSKNLVPEHAYSIDAVYGSVVMLRNPWGGPPQPMSLSDMLQDPTLSLEIASPLDNVTETSNLLASGSPDRDQSAGKLEFETLDEVQQASVIAELLWTRNDPDAANRAMETYKRAAGKSNNTFMLMRFFEALTQKMTEKGHKLDANDRALLSNWEGELAPYMTATLNRASIGTTGDDLQKIFNEEFRVPELVYGAENRTDDASRLFNEATPEVQASVIAVLLWHHKDLVAANRLIGEYTKAGGSKNNAIDTDKFLVAFTNQMTAEGHLLDSNDILFLGGWRDALGNALNPFQLTLGSDGRALDTQFHGPSSGLPELWVIDAATSSDASLQAQASARFNSLTADKKASVLVQLLWDRKDLAAAKRLMQSYTGAAGQSESLSLLNEFITKMGSNVLDANAIEFLNGWAGPMAPKIQQIAQRASIGMTASALKGLVEEMHIGDDITDNAKKGN